MAAENEAGPALTKAEQTRDRLLRAAVDAFAERGFHGATTRDLAAAAGMSPAAVYVHYPSKEHLLYELSVTGHRRTLKVLEANDDPALPPAARLYRLIRAFALHHAEHHTTARILNYELAALAPEHGSEVAALRLDIARRVHAPIKAGIEAGAFHTSDPRAVNLAITSMNIDIARWYTDEGPGTMSPEELAEAYAALALRMVEADPD